MNIILKYVNTVHKTNTFLSYFIQRKYKIALKQSQNFESLKLYTPE
jgi:hypothetical protein